MRASFSFPLNFSTAPNRWVLALSLGFVLLGGLVVSRRSYAQSAAALTSASVDHSIKQTVERLDMIVKSSRVLSLGDRIPRFQVHNEEVLGATPVSENQIQIFGKNPGTTQINLWDTNDKLYTIDVTVIADARELEGILSSQLPLASLRVTPIAESAILSGHVTSVDDVDRAVAIAEQFYTVVINNIEVVGVQQVLLHTKIMEVSRTKLRQLGIDLAFNDTRFGVFNGPGNILNASSSLTSPASTGQDNINGLLSINGNFNSLVKALNKNNLIKLLAEPTVVATHGRPARFTVGGKVPYIIPGANGQVQVAYEDYGTSLDFLPFVVGPGRIRLEVRPEVSEPDASRSIISGGANVTAFTTRYVETAVEMQSGQTFALAGLLQSRTETEIRRTPLLGSIPYVGALFRNTQERRNEIELLIMVTPEIVEAMDPHQVPMGGPGLNSDSPDDTEFYCLGHIEVPNLKGDNDGLMDGCEGTIAVPEMSQPVPMHQAPMMHQNPINHDEPVIFESGGVAPQANRSKKTPSTRTATRNNRSTVESGTLISPPGVVPSSEPTIVGDGVTVSSPSLR